MTDDGYFLSAANPVANTDQLAMEDRALRLIRRPEIERARMVAGHLFREVAQNTAGEQMARFDNMIEEYTFHYAMRATASDGNHPGVVRFMQPPHRWFGRDVPGSRWGGDSPDFTYRIIPVSHGGRYVIRGRHTCDRPPTAHYAVMSDNTAAPTIMGLLDSLDVPADANGEFVITIDADPADGRKNHIQLQPGALQIWIRDALTDWYAQSPNALRIERLNPPEREPLSDEELGRWMARAMVDGVYYTNFICQAITTRPPNQITAPASSGPLGGMASQYTCSSNIMLAEDQAMIITASDAGALFRNAVPTDVFMLTDNYWDRMGHLSSGDMAPDESGLFTYVVSHRDPGIHNWIDTNGLGQLIFGQRWQSFPGGAAREAPTMEVRVVDLADLAMELPRGVRTIDAAGRKDQIARRRAGFDKRFVDR